MSKHPGCRRDVLLVPNSSLCPGQGTHIFSWLCTVSCAGSTIPCWVTYSTTGSPKSGSGMKEHNKPCLNPFFWVMWSKKPLSSQISLNKHAHNQILLFILSACLSRTEHWPPISWHPTRLSSSVYWALHLLPSSSNFRLADPLKPFYTEIRREKRAESLSLQLCPGFPHRQDFCPISTLEQSEFKGWSIPCWAASVKADITYHTEIILVLPID